MLPSLRSTPFGLRLACSASYAGAVGLVYDVRCEGDDARPAWRHQPAWHMQVTKNAIQTPHAALAPVARCEHPSGLSSHNGTPGIVVGGLRRSLTPIGRIALLSETASNPSISGAVIELDGPLIDADELSAALDVGLCASSYRFRSIVDQSTLSFEEIGNFEARRVVRVDSEDESLEAWAARWLTAPFDRRAPLWECRIRHVSPNRSVLLVRVHHCLADGVSLAWLLGKLSDQASELGQFVETQVDKRRRMLRSYGWPGRLLIFLALAMRLVLFFVRMLMSLALVHRPLTRSKRAGTRSVAWANFSDVDTLRRIAKRLGGKQTTVNDVFAAIVSAGLQPYCASGAVMVAVPVHLYGGVLPKGVEIGNAIGAVLAPLPLPSDDPRSHLAAVSERLGRPLRSGVAHLAAYAAACVLGFVAPPSLVPSAMQGATSSASCALTNIKGSPLALTVCGRRVVSIAP